MLLPPPPHTHKKPTNFVREAHTQSHKNTSMSANSTGMVSSTLHCILVYHCTCVWWYFILHRPTRKAYFSKQKQPSSQECATGTLQVNKSKHHWVSLTNKQKHCPGAKGDRQWGLAYTTWNISSNSLFQAASRKSALPGPTNPRSCHMADRWWSAGTVQ